MPVVLLRALPWLALLLLLASPTHAEEPASLQALWQKIEPFTKPPAEFVGKFGPYRSLLELPDGKRMQSADEWPQRREQILQTWHKRLGPWPPLVEKPEVKRLESVERASGYFTTHADADPDVNARTAGVYLRADPEDLSILDGRDDSKRAELIAECLTRWKSIKNA